MEARILVDHLKCGGCANTINKQLMLLQGILSVKVVPEEGLVQIWYAEEQSLVLARKKLAELGYPEAGTTQGIDKLASNLKSYVSCAAGRFSRRAEEKKTD